MGAVSAQDRSGAHARPERYANPTHAPRGRRRAYTRSVALVTAYHGPHAALIPVTLPALARHAERHHHDLILAAPAGHDVYAQFAGVRAMRQALDHHDAAVWLDADCLVSDRTPNLATLLDGADAMYAVDGPSVLVHLWAVRSTPRLRRLLDEMWAGRNRRPGTTHVDDIHGRFPPDARKLQVTRSGRVIEVAGVVHCSTADGLDVPAAVQILSRADHFNNQAPDT